MHEYIKLVEVRFDFEDEFDFEDDFDLMQVWKQSMPMNAAKHYALVNAFELLDRCPDGKATVIVRDAGVEYAVDVVVEVVVTAGDVRRVNTKEKEAR